ncbi:D-alanyl-D-alanine carboxypeptidase [Lachnospiraceae bacterium AM48-27BH]|nr:D-alanyl-D-alanine carboxypeptidase [Lachnospiraceae bacterium AM48-27BH]
MKKKTIYKIACCLTAGFLLCSCGKKEEALDRPYSFTERSFPVELTDSTDGYASLFASDLCVVTDESQYSPSDTTSEAAGLFDITDGQVMYSKNAFERLYPASITKVMTALIAIKYGDLTDTVTVTEDAVITEAGATLAGIHPGDQLTMEQLLYGLMLPSGNDAGAAIAVHMAGSIDAFAELMNREAQKLGATGTHFMNPHGLTNADHYTTAYDLYLIFNEALKQPEFRKVTGTTSYTADYTDGSGNPVSTTWEGGNWYMVGQRQTPDGLTVFSGKTGTTSAAGFCLIMASRDQKEKEYISVVLKAPSRPGLYDNMTNIISKIVD